MRHRSPRPAVASAVALTALVALAAGSARAEESAPRAAAVAPGQRFAAGSFPNLNGAEGQPASVDLRNVLGKKPVVLYYWIAGNRMAEDLLVELDRMRAELGPDAIAFYGVAAPRPERPAEVIRARVAALGVGMPILSDETFEIGSKLFVRSIPNVSIVDAAGTLRLTNGASLRQTLEYKMDLEAAIRRVARTGDVGTYGFLPRYHPVNELIGEQCPDFRASTLDASVERSWRDMLSKDKLNVLVFWSVDCPHCRESLPEIDAWLKKNPNAVNLVTTAFVDGESTEAKTREYCSTNGFGFPTLMDRDHSARDRFRITSTPTIVIIRPDGVVDSVLLSGHGDFGAAIEKKRSELALSAG
jgi:thiol-disulfide isomerase/thioredoxin